MHRLRIPLMGDVLAVPSPGTGKLLPVDPAGRECHTEIGDRASTTMGDDGENAHDQKVVPDKLR